MSKVNWFRKICSVLIMIALAVFLFLLRYDVFLSGDEVGVLVTNNPDNTYIDNLVLEGECELNLDYSLITTWKELVDSYFVWSGRTVTRIIKPFVRMMFSLPDGMNWLVFSLYIATVLFAMFLVVLKNISGSVRRAMDSPLLVMITGVILFYIPSYSYAYTSKIIYFTITNTYVVSVIFYLLFYLLLKQVYEQSNPPAIGRTIGVNIVGALAGLSHEAYGVIFGAILLVQLIRFWMREHRRISIRYLSMYIGYFIGFCVCFFAPGNFNRAQQNHEIELRTVPLLSRLFNSIYIHTYVAYKLWLIPGLAIPLIIAVGIFLLIRKKLTLREIITVVVRHMEWFIGFAMSALTWGMVAKVVVYGPLAANVMLCIGIMKVFLDLWNIVRDKGDLTAAWKERTANACAICSMVILTILVVINYPQITAVHKVANVWRTNICRARANEDEEVLVPAYPENIDYRFYNTRVLNSQYAYDKVSYRVVLGTHVVIDTSEQNGGDRTDGT